jgi:hypothetical protein
MNRELPGDFTEVEDALRAHRAPEDALQLDSIKRDVMTRAGRRSSVLRRSRTLTLSLAGALVLTGGTTGVLAVSKLRGPGSAAVSQYCPPKQLLRNTGLHCLPPSEPISNYKLFNRH